MLLKDDSDLRLAIFDFDLVVDEFVEVHLAGRRNRAILLTCVIHKDLELGFVDGDGDATLHVFAVVCLGLPELMVALSCVFPVPHQVLVGLEGLEEVGVVDVEVRHSIT